MYIQPFYYSRGIDQKFNAILIVVSTMFLFADTVFLLGTAESTKCISVNSLLRIVTDHFRKIATYLKRVV